MLYGWLGGVCLCMSALVCIRYIENLDSRNFARDLDVLWHSIGSGLIINA